MTRLLAAALAFLMTAVAVSSACAATDGTPVRFTLDPGTGSNDVRAHFGLGRERDIWSTDLPIGQLAGLDWSAFRAAGSRPLHFAMQRDSGRLDCAGQGGSSHATGQCSFSADPGFASALAAQSIARPNRNQWISLFALDVRRELLTALRAARYPAPTIDTLLQLTAVGVTSRYIGDMDRAGYRPRTLGALVELKALDVTPQWIGGLAGVGYAGLPSSALVQLKALGVTVDDIRGFQSLGYRNLSADQLVQWKALGVTPSFARQMQARHGAVSPEQLVELRVVGDLASRR